MNVLETQGWGGGTSLLLSKGPMHVTPQTLPGLGWEASTGQ